VQAFDFEGNPLEIMKAVSDVLSETTLKALTDGYKRLHVDSRIGLSMPGLVIFDKVPETYFGDDAPFTGFNLLKHLVDGSQVIAIERTVYVLLDQHVMAEHILLLKQGSKLYAHQKFQFPHHDLKPGWYAERITTE
jgi:hypothetical protein